MPRRFGVAAPAALGLALAACWAAARPPSPAPHRLSHGRETMPQLETAPTTAYVGPRSCAAAGCHNGNDLARPAGSEYSLWSARDPHAGAFAVLGGDLSHKIMKAHRGGGDARKDRDCLACHSLTAAPGVAAPPDDLLADGVSCEACHGPAAAWLDEHYTESWRGRSTEEAEQRGFFPARDLARRTALCAGCHVGRPGVEVGHDLIAAGHPRLAFEYTAYHDLLPRHWEREKLPRVAGQKDDAEYGRDFLARAWEIGQVTAARQEKDLVASRKSPVRDFADLDCFACHHDLREPSWRQERPAGGKLGLAAPSDWYTAGPAALADGGGLDLDVRPLKDWKRWADALQGAAVKAALGGETAKPEAVRALLLRLTRRDAEGDGPADWDHAAQTYLAAAALSRALDEVDRGAAPRVAPDVVRRLRDLLAFPPARDGGRIDSPRAFTPREFREALKAVRAAFGG